MGRTQSDDEFDASEMDFSDSEDFIDDISDADLMPDLLKTKPRESDGVDSVIIVDGIPVVGSTERLEKLKGVIRKIFLKYGNVVTEHYPVNEKGETKGYMFLEYSKHQDAVEAVKERNNYKLDKNHILSVNLFSDFEKYEAISDEWEPPKEEPYLDQVLTNLFIYRKRDVDVAFFSGQN